MKAKITVTKFDEHYVIEGMSFYHIHPGKGFNRNVKGFSIWHGGCGIGNARTINEARKVIHDNAKAGLQRKIKQHEAEIVIAKQTLAKLSDDHFNLAMFKNPNYHGYECNHFNGKAG